MNEIIARFKERFETLSPFQKFLGMKLEVTDSFTPVITFDMKNDLIGNFDYGILHGGVIASVMDVTAGISALLCLPSKYPSESADQIMKRVSKVGTIDLRIDYIQPGRGKSFTATGETLRAGNKIAVSTAKLHNDEGVLIAAGTGTYLIG